MPFMDAGEAFRRRTIERLTRTDEMLYRELCNGYRYPASGED